MKNHKMENKMKEEKRNVEKELSSLLARTISLEDEMNKLVVSE